MPAGFKYDLKPIEASMPEMCRFETVYRYSGGFNLDISNLTGVAQIPPLTPLVLDFVKRTGTVPSPVPFPRCGIFLHQTGDRKPSKESRHAHRLIC